MPAGVWIINLVVLGAVYEADLGHRKITHFRLIRPLLLVAGIVLFYFKTVGTTGNALTFELILLVLGIGLGVAAGSLFHVYWDKGASWSRAGFSYAALCAAVIGARLVCVYATYHSQALDRWLTTRGLSSDTITDALLFMAVAMVLARTASLRVRAQRLHGADSDVLQPTMPIPAVTIPDAHG
jgi:hypothetical protein